MKGIDILLLPHENVPLLPALSHHILQSALG
jgi:hypothetical protein